MDCRFQRDPQGQGECFSRALLSEGASIKDRLIARRKAERRRRKKEKGKKKQHRSIKKKREKKKKESGEEEEEGKKRKDKTNTRWILGAQTDVEKKLLPQKVRKGRSGIS